MPIRVTQSMLNTQLLQNLQNNFVRMDKLQNQLATGRKINKPSDDPVGISYSMRYRSELSANEQYQKNLDSAMSWMEFSDSMLGQAGDVLQRVRELAVKAANGTNPQAALDSIHSEVSQLKEQMVNIGNSQFNGKFVFNGQLTNIEPYSDSATAASAETDQADILFEVSMGVKMAVNVSGQDVFGAPSTVDEPNPSNAFQIFDLFTTSLENADADGLNQVIDNIDDRIDQVLQVRADIGAKTNRLELMTSRQDDIEINLTSLLSKTEDADMAEIITRLKMDENIYQASLSAGAKLIRPSLIDFLR